MRITKYPEFENINIEHKEAFDAAFKARPPVISEFTFTNIYSWKQAYNFKVSYLGGLLILSSEDKTGTHFFEPAGKGDLGQAIKLILSEGRGDFIRVSEEVKNGLVNGDFLIKEDRDNADYLYLSSDLIGLKGGKYDGKRNLIKKFKASCQYSYEELTGANAPEIWAYEELWCSRRDCQNSLGLANEKKAIHEIVGNFLRFPLKAGAIRIDGSINAVAVGEALNAETFVAHVLKADSSRQGLYQVISNEFFSRQAAGFKYINLEQDLGIESLRVSKNSYHPLKLLNKYSISLNKH